MFISQVLRHLFYLVVIDMCRCYDCRWCDDGMNQGYWHKCVCFTCRKVGSKGQSSEESGYKERPIMELWPICSRCNKKMVMCGPDFKAPKYNNIKRWKYLQKNWNTIHTYEERMESLKRLRQWYKKRGSQ